MAKKNITVNIDCDDFCPYDTEEIFSTVQEMISIFNQKDPHKVYEALDNDHGFIVGNAYDETEFFFEDEKYYSRIYEIKEKDIIETLQSVKYEQQTESKTLEEVTQ